ncbi:hypothetical protein HDV00_011257 [Rhizophlyctis rosea]|nr:hypothetical protein HDV00_011257 [Rhizophlyctis rosea]
MILDDSVLSECGIKDVDAVCTVSQAIKLAGKILKTERIRCPYAFLEANRDLVFDMQDHPEDKEKPWIYSCRPSYGIVLNNHISEITVEHEKKSLAARVRDACKPDFDKVKSSQKGSKEQKAECNDDIDAEGFYDLWNHQVEDVVREILEDNTINTNTAFILADSEDENGKVRVHDSSVLEKVLLEIVTQTRAVPNVKTTTSTRTKRHTMDKIIFPDTGNQIYIENNRALKQGVCEALEVPFANQSVSMIGKAYLEKKLPRFRPSVMNEKLLNIIDSTGKPAGFFGNTYDGIPEEEVVGYDMPKCYQKAWLNMPFANPVFNLFDLEEPYDDVICKGASVPGWYFVSTDNIFPLNGGGWISHSLLQFAEQNGIAFSIETMILASECLPKDYFSSSINKLVEKLGNEEAKFVINSLIGTFGKATNICPFRTLYIPKEDEAVHYCLKYRKEGYHSTLVKIFDKELHGIDLFQVTRTVGSETYETHKAIRKQIMEWANCMIYTKIEDLLGGEFDFSRILAIKTDCLMLRENDVTKDESVLSLWNIIYLYKKAGVKVFIFGDGDVYTENIHHYGQTSSVEEDENKILPEYLNSDIVKQIGDNNLIFLDTNHRYVADPSNKMHELVDAVQRGITQFPDMTASREQLNNYRLNICYTNRMRQYVYGMHMDNDEKRTHRKGFRSDRIPGDVKTQQSFFTAGSPVIARKRAKAQNVIKGTMWSVQSWTNKDVKLRRKVDNETDAVREFGKFTNLSCKIPHDHFQRFFISAYCLTTHMPQGRTFDQDYVIHEKEKMDARLLSTSVSRLRHSKYVHFSDIKVPGLDDPLMQKNLRASLASIQGCTFEDLVAYMTPKLPGRYNWTDYGWE